MGRRARRALAASTPIIFGNATTMTTTPTNPNGNCNDTVIGYQCTCYRQRCRCGASGVRLLDANSMAATRMMGVNQSYCGGYGYGYGYGYGGNDYGCGSRRHHHQRHPHHHRQGPIAALVGGLIGLAIEKHGERKAAREAAVEVEAEVEQQEEQEVGRRQTTTRHVEVVDDSSSSENEAEELDAQTHGVVNRPAIGERQSSKKGEKGEKKLRKNPPQIQPQQRTAEQVMQYRESENHWESAPPPYSA